MPRRIPVERELAVLEEIIQYYLEHHEAISARTLAKVSRLALSPTTIRNLMEDLSADGMLTSEGVPRGRVPTQKAFGIYVARLSPERGSAGPAQAAQGLPDREAAAGGESHRARSPRPAPVRGLPTLADALEETGMALAGATGCVVLAAFPAPDVYPLGWVHFGTVPANGPSHRILVALHTLLDDLWSRMLDTPAPFPEDLLREVARFINGRYRGTPLGRIREDIMAGEPKDLLDRTPSLGAAFRLLRKAFEWERIPQRAWGQENLFRMQVGQDAQHLYLLQQALAHPDLLRRGLDQGRTVAGARVALGTETGFEGLEACALIGHRFGAGQWEGTLGVLGPMGMPYPRVLEAVVAAAQSLSDVVFGRIAAAHAPGATAGR